MSRDLSESLVVVGNGMVSYRFCRTLVERGGHERYRVIVVGDESRPAYDRVHLTELFAGKDADELTFAPVGWYEDHGIDLYLGDRIVAIDREARLVRSAGGRGIPYDRLILATGSKPVVPSVKGTDLSGVFRYRTVDDLNAMLAYAAMVKSALVLGGGLLGLEAARALQNLGLDVAVVEARGPGLMARQLDRDGGKALQAEVEKLGVKVFAGRQTRSIEKRGEDRIVRFAYGEEAKVGMVVIAVGVRPRDELGAAADLPCGKFGGVVIDDRLRTSDPNIFAIGEVACHRGKLYGFVAPGQRMADVMAINLTDGDETFEGWMPSAKLKLMGVEVAMAGDLAAADEGQVVIGGPTKGTYRKLFLDRGRVTAGVKAAVSVGVWREFARVQDAIADGRRLWPWNIYRFRRTGHIWSGESAPVSDWADDARICTCTGVTRGQLGAAIARGATTVDGLAKQTGASTVCGSCLPLLTELVGGASAEAAGRQRGLLIASVLAALMSLFVASVSFFSAPDDARARARGPARSCAAVSVRRSPDSRWSRLRSQVSSSRCASDGRGSPPATSAPGGSCTVPWAWRRSWFSSCIRSFVSASTSTSR